MRILSLLFAWLSVSTVSYGQRYDTLKQKANITFPQLMVLSDDFERFFPNKNKIEKIVSDKYWLEGPVWVKSLNGLLFSDVVENRIYFWNQQRGLSIWLQPSGFSNGLLLDANGDLLLAQGNYRSNAVTKRQIGKIAHPLFNKTVTPFLSNFEGKQFNSPNDIALGANGNLYFTDPVYGLANGDSDKLKELRFNGVFKFANNTLTVLIDSLKSPNGIGLSPDHKFLYVSDSETGRLLCYELDSKGDIVKAVHFFNLKEMLKHTISSTVLAWDGMAVSKQGVIFAAGWGGVWIISPTGTLLGHIQTPDFTSNTEVDDKGEYLYWTAGKIPFEKGSSCLYASPKRCRCRT
ncbi:MAG: SMP-30/gluconolactonase/LRE family protein [Flavisolibacter sp.]